MYKRLPEKVKKDLIERVKKGESLSSVCLEVGISRTIFYRWLKTYSSSTSTEKVDSIKHPKAFSKNLEGKIVKLSLSNPDWTVRQIATEAGVSVHGAWNVLNRKKLNTKKDRGLYREKHGKSLVKAIRVDVKHTIIQRYETGESVTELCNKFGISRTVFYRWLKRYQAQGRKEHALRSIRPEGDDHWKSKPEAREMILQIVIEHPEFSAHKLAAAIHARSGKKILGVHGVHNLLTRLNLSHMTDRLIYSRTHAQAIFIPPVPSVINLPETPRYSFISHLPPPVQKFVTSYGLLTLTSFVISLFGITYISTIYNAGSIGGAIGVTFAWLALILGTFFFIYSIKYYLTIAVVLSYSRQQENTSKDSHENTMQTFWGRLFGVEISVQNANKTKAAQSEKARYGLQHDLSHVTLERYPFVSLQLSTYNEKRVINRLLTAATSMDYPNYEVILADDSTDETIDIIKQWENHPRVKISRRLSRDGYKGGALREALKITEPRAEFVLIFDADFIPYPDTITQFLKYFQYTAGSLDFTGTEVQGTRYKEEQDTALSTAPLHLTNSASVSNIAAVQGYQWHVLNKSENWITRGVRSEYSGSYVIERSGAEVYGGLKQISGSVYMIRRDVLQSIGWGTSITEDFELTLKLYSKGWKVVYTPYIQAPAEAVSTLKRLIRQRMRWAEGHSFNIKHMFTQLLFGQWVERGSLATLANSESRTQNSELNDYKVSKLESNSNNIILNSKLNSELSTLNSKSNKEFIPSPLTFMEKLEFLYLTPYYLQAAFFILGTIAWLISETIFQVRLPFWTEVWGWSLVLTNLFALPLMNLVGLFMEESEDKDYQGLLSFVALSYIVAPFQAYAAIKGFMEDKEGPWFRTPKTGRITDIFIPGRFARIFSGIFKGRTVGVGATAAIAKPIFASNQYLSLATANNLFNNFRIRKKQRRWVGNAFFTSLVIVLIIIIGFTPLVTSIDKISANTGEFRKLSNLFESSTEIRNKNEEINKDEIMKNVLSKEIDTPRSIVKELKDGSNIEFIFHKEPRVRIKVKDGEMEYETMQIGGKSVMPSKSILYKDNKATYIDVLPGIDIQYSINGDLLIEEYIVKNRDASKYVGEIIQNISVSGLKLVSAAPETFGIYYPDGKPAFQFSSPFAKDSAGNISNDIRFILRKNVTGHQLVKKLGNSFNSWLNSSERAYPIYIDPSIVVSGGVDEVETQFGSLQRKLVYASSNWYAFYNVSGKVYYQKSSNGTSWGTAVDLDSSDSDNYNTTVALSGTIIHAFWVDDGAEVVEGRRINTASSDAQGTLCQTASQGTISSSFTVSAAALSATAVVAAYSDTSTDTEVDIFEITGLDGSCAVTDVNPGNIIFGSGITAGDRPVLVPIDSDTVDIVFQDGNLSYSRYEATLDEWVKNNLTIASVTHNIYSATTNGTTVWVLAADTTQTDDALLYSIGTDDWAETTIDSDAGGNNQDGISDLDIFCVSATDCKLVYTDLIDTASPDIIFVDCNDAACSSNTPTTLDADIDGDTTIDNDPGNPRVFCSSGTDCKIVYQTALDTAAPQIIFHDCDGADNTNACSSSNAEVIDTDFGGTPSFTHFAIDCPASDNCKFLYYTDDSAVGNSDRIIFVDCVDEDCSDTGETKVEIMNPGNILYGPHLSLYCVTATQCKAFMHDADTGSVVLVDCSTASNTETCATPPAPDTIDSDVGTTQGNVSVDIDCIGGNTDCKLVYGDDTDDDLTFVDCSAADCSTTNSTTDIDATGGSISATTVSVSMDCISATDCKITYVNSDSTINFVDCDDAGCTTGSVLPTLGPRYKSSVYCPATGDCKLVYYEGTAGTAPAVMFADCDSTNCFPTSSDLADPWTGETNLTGVSLTYDSSNTDLIASAMTDSSEQAYFRITDVGSISWGTEYSYGYTAGSMGHISAPLSVAGYSQMGVVVRQGTNYEFATLPENIWIMSMILPIFVLLGRRYNRQRKKMLLIKYK